MSQSIPFFNYPALFRQQKAELLSTIEGVLAGGRYILQAELESFETNLARFLDVRHAFGVGNGTDALLIALRAAGVEAGDEVILPSHTFVATASAVHHAGAVPILADVRNDHMIDPEHVASLVTERTRALMPVQLNGRTSNMDALSAIAGKHDLLVVEDAAQALGSRFDGRAAGTFGVAAGFSFYPAKLLGCFGDGGGVVTNDAEVAHRVGLLRNHGRDDHGDVRLWSYNSRLDNVQAAVLDLKLRTFSADIERRRVLAAGYHERLSGVGDLLLPPPPGVDSWHFDVYQNYEIETERRDDLRQHLSARGIGTIIQWGGKAVHQFRGLGFEGVHLPVTERVMARSLLLPIHVALSDDELDQVADGVRAFFG